MKLKDYIYKHYRNSQKDFANSIGRSPQLVAHYIKQGYQVMNGQLVDVKLTMPEGKESEFDQGVAAVCSYIINNGEAIPEEDILQIGSKVITNNDKESK